jgi:uncharacterized iron-regulated membrane protein
MTRVGLAIVLVLACGCRRRHVEPSDEVAAPPPPPAVQASGASAENPSGTAALPRPKDRAPLPDGGTLNDDPRGPRPAEWKPVVDAAMPALQACFDAANLPPGEIPVKMHYTVEQRGETGAVTANASAPQAVLDCCARVIEGLRFPPYGGPKVERDLGFTWFKRAPGADGGAATPGKTP